MAKKEEFNKEELDHDRNFCTSCGAELDQYSVESGQGSKEDMHKKIDECKKTGRFQGGVCSKLFIDFADEEDLIDD